MDSRKWPSMVEEVPLGASCDEAGYDSRTNDTGRGVLIMWPFKKRQMTAEDRIMEHVAAKICKWDCDLNRTNIKSDDNGLFRSGKHKETITLLGVDITCCESWSYSLNGGHTNQWLNIGKYDASKRALRAWNKAYRQREKHRKALRKEQMEVKDKRKQEFLEDLAEKLSDE